MAPKAKGKAKTPTPPEEEEEDIPEDEEGPGKVAFSFRAESVENLPCDLETQVLITAIGRDYRSDKAEPSQSPSGWGFKRTQLVRDVKQSLFDDLVNCPLTIALRDVSPEQYGTVIGRASLSLLPLLHEKTEVGGQLEVKLTEEYYAKWFPESAEGETSPAGSIDPPKTTIGFYFSVAELVGPSEDRDTWTTVTLGVPGIFALPTDLSSISADNLEAHCIKYQAAFLGEQLDDGKLVEPAEQPPEEEDAEAVDENQLSQADWCAFQERRGMSVQFPRAKFVVYRGANFRNELRSLLNHIGGIWFYFTLEEKPAADPKKPNPAEATRAARLYGGKAWLDLRPLIMPTARTIETVCPLISTSTAEAEAAEPKMATLEESRTFVRLTLELSRAVVPEQHPDQKVMVPSLLPAREDIQKIPPSTEATSLYVEALTRSIEAITRDCANGVSRTGGVSGAVEILKKAGSYDDIKRDLRAGILRVFRDRLQKDTSVIPGNPLVGDERDAFFSDTYSYLRSEMVDVVHGIRNKEPEPVLVSPSEPTSSGPHRQSNALSGGSRLDSLPPRTSSVGLGVVSSAPGKRPSTQGKKEMSEEELGQIGSDRVASRSKDSPSPEMMTPSNSAVEEREEAGNNQMNNAVAVALAESAAARSARKALGLAVDAAERCSRLAYEAELIGNWDRAAKLWQNQLVLEQNRDDPKIWVNFAKFCMRARCRQEAAEEALRQAVAILAEKPAAFPPQVIREVDLMLALILLDRGRCEEAMRAIREYQEKDLADSTLNFLLGLCLFLYGEDDQAKPYLNAAGKTRDFFDGLADIKAIEEKLSSEAATNPPVPERYVEPLEYLLDCGLSSLVFTFLDQTETLSQEVLGYEPLALIDAKASALDRDFQSAIARLEPLLASGEATREAWRTAGECHLQIQDYDKAVQELQHALYSFEEKYEDPAVYIRLANVYIIKKKWKHARDVFLKSINWKPTAEAWSGIGYAEFRADEYQVCYEALCEANLLDGERYDVWASLTLVHLRNENWDLAKQNFQKCLDCGPDGDELLLDVANACNKGERQVALAEVAARRALEIRDSGRGHSELAESLKKQGQLEEAVVEAQAAIKKLTDMPEERKAFFDKALVWCEELANPALTEALRAAQTTAEREHAAHAAQEEQKTTA